jgi:hypothetical protein
VRQRASTKAAAAALARFVRFVRSPLLNHLVNSLMSLHTRVYD